MGLNIGVGNSNRSMFTTLLGMRVSVLCLHGPCSGNWECREQVKKVRGGQGPESAGQSRTRTAGCPASGVPELPTEDFAREQNSGGAPLRPGDLLTMWGSSKTLVQFCFHFLFRDGAERERKSQADFPRAQSWMQGSILQPRYHELS